MENKDIEKMLIAETKDITPNVLPRLKDRLPYLEEVKETKKRFNFKLNFKIGLLVLTTCFAILLILNISLYNTKYETVTIDTNPSVELVLNRFERVIDVNYNNDDAYDTFSDVNLKNKKASDAIEVCLNELYDAGYFDNEENVIIVSGNNAKKDITDKIEKYQKLVEEFSNSKGKKTEVITNIVDEAERDLAEVLNIGFGQLKMIYEILGKSKDYTFDDLKNLSMKELKEIYNNLKNNK